MIDFPTGQIAEIADEVAVSAVTVGELQYGVDVATDALTQLRRRRRVQIIIDRFDVLPFDVIVAEYYGALASSCASTAVTSGHAGWICRSQPLRHATAYRC